MRQPATKSKPPPPQPKWKAVLLGALFLALLVLACWPALRGGFIWDDDAYVTNNPLLKAKDGWQCIWFSAHRQSQFFPLVFTTLRLEYALWGLNSLGYHLVNVLLLATNAVLVWVVLRKLVVPEPARIGSAEYRQQPVDAGLHVFRWRHNLGQQFHALRALRQPDQSRVFETKLDAGGGRGDEVRRRLG